jgi:hypothetical protein
MRRRALAATVAMLTAGWLLVHFYDRFWYAPDEGNYAHVAQRVLQGETLNLQVQDVHPGYISFVNAAALKLFGPDLVSLRYPLIVLALLQAAALFSVFPGARAWDAAVAVIVLTALGTIQFLNPTAHWYCLALTILLIAALTHMPRTGARLVTAGVLIGTIALFRQLTGVLVGIGTIAYLLGEMQGESRDTIAARLLVGAMIAVLSLYLLFATDVSGIALFGIWPLLLLAHLFRRPTARNRDVLVACGLIGAGIVVAVLPLLSYHLMHGSLFAWAEDVGPAAVALTRMDFFGRTNYAALIVHAIRQIASARDLPLLLNGAFWTVMPLIAAINGIVVLYLWTRSRLEVAPLPLIATFYAIVSVHFQIPVYLYYTTGLSIASLLWLAPRLFSPGKTESGPASAFAKATADGKAGHSGGPAEAGLYTALATAMALAAIGVYFHAGQPASRSMTDILHGRRIASVRASVLPHCSLSVDPAESGRYAAVVDLIQQRVPEHDAILAIPSNAELYFLSGRRNAFRFYNTALGVRDEAAVEAVERVLRDSPPKLVTFNAADKYNTRASLQIMDVVKRRYVLLGRYEPFDVYVLP